MLSMEYVPYMYLRGCFNIIVTAENCVRNVFLQFFSALLGLFK